MFQNNFNGGFYGNYGQAYVPTRKPRFTNPLTEEDKKSFKTQGGFNLFVDEKELKRSYCTHKDGDQISLRNNNDGTVTCWICGETFTLADLEEQRVREITEDYISLLQSIKTYYLDIPDGVTKEFFQMIPFIKKTPEIYKLAISNFQSYENPMLTPMNNGMQLFNMYDSISNPAFMGAPMYGGMPNYAPAPMPYAAPPMGTTPVGGFGYVDNGAPVGAVPAQMAPNPIPQPVTAPSPAPAPAAPSDSVTQVKTFTL